MKTFFQFSEQAKRHSRRKLNEAAPAPAQAQPDYAKFTAAWTEFVKDPNNAAIVQAMGKTALAQLPAEVQKLAQAKPAAAPAAAPAATTPTAPATGAPAVATPGKVG